MPVNQWFGLTKSLEENALMRSNISKTIVLCFLLSPIKSGGQDLPEIAILKRASEYIKQAKPNWLFQGAVCTVPQLIDEQQGISCGSFLKIDDSSEMFAHVFIYRISSAEAASRWIKWKNRLKLDKWETTIYDLADEAILTRRLDIRHFSIAFRKGCFLAVVDGNRKEDVEFVSHYLLDK